MSTYTNRLVNVGKPKLVSKPIPFRSLPSTPTLEVYYEDTTNCITLVSGRISVISDYDGDYTFTQGTASERPLYGSYPSPNGKDGGYYDDYSNNYGATGANTFIDNNDGQTIACACGELSSDGDCIFGKWHGGDNERRYIFNTSSYTVAQNAGSYNSNNTAEFTRPTGSFHVIIGQWNPGVHTKVWVDGTLAGTAVTPPTTPLGGVVSQPVKIGRRSDNNNPLTTGEIYSLLVWRTGQFTESQLEDIWLYLYRRYTK